MKPRGVNAVWSHPKSTSTDGTVNNQLYGKAAGM